MSVQDKIDEIRWRVANRPVAYLMPGLQPDPVAHDDIEFLLKTIDELQNLLNVAADKMLTSSKLYSSI